jgi:copper chaperone NosL
MSLAGRKLACAALLAVLAAGPQARGEEPVPRPGQQDRCPVCGMFVAKYRHWVAAVVYRDQTRVFFDGAKDLFRYLFDLPRYAPAHKAEDIQSVYVTEYYDTDVIPATVAYYVIGSDAFGPMGHELVPLRTRAAAEEFMKDHRGRQILAYTNITPEVVGRLGGRGGR